MNKKVLMAAGVVSTLCISSNVIAATFTHSIGVDAINTKIVTDPIYGGGQVTKNTSETHPSWSVNYKYIINYNNIFIAPEIFYDSSDLTYNYFETGATYRMHYKTKQKYRAGPKLNLGYTFRKITPYASIGYAEARYKEKTELQMLLAGQTEYTEQNTIEESVLYGVGLRYEFNDKLDFNSAYEIQDIDTATDISVFKIGLGYKF